MKRQESGCWREDPISTRRLTLDVPIVDELAVLADFQHV